MSRNGRSLLRLSMVLALGLSGCAAVAPTGTGDEPNNTDVLGAAATDSPFEADQDPAVAALAFVENELIVQPYPGADAAALTALYGDANARILDALPDIDAVVLEVAPDHLWETAARLVSSGLIETTHKNYVFSPDAAPNDPLFARQDHLTQIQAPQAWDMTTGSSSIVIAVVDTGVDRNHPDLSGKIIDGWNVYGNNADYADVLGHGTQVAGVAAAASNNAVGVAGVSWASPVLAVRVGDAQGLSTSRHIAAGILWAVGHGAKVINASFAPLWSDRIVRSAAQQAFNRGCVVVISAGNAGGLNSVAGYDEALFVGAINPTNEIASFSDRGPFVDLCAPGTGVRTTAKGGDYSLANGTSFAAPVVTGVAALVLSLEPGLRPASVQSALLNTAVDLGSAGKDDVFGYGLVDAAAAVADAQRVASLADGTPPTVRIAKPKSNEVLSGRYAASVEASDVSGVADVVFSVDDIPYATDTRAPYQFVVDTLAFNSGTHTFAFIATDAAGNRSSARTVNVVFATAAASTGSPTISFRSPSAGATVTGDVTIRASVADSDGLAVIEWLIDGQSVFTSPLTGTSSGVSYVWRGNGATPGPHSITVLVTDATGAQGRGTLALIRQ